MTVLIINQSEVPQLLPMETCMAVMAGALERLARGEVVNPLRQMITLADGSGLLGVMPACYGNGSAAGEAAAIDGAMGLKVITVFPGNEGTPYDSHQGAVLLFETQHGRLQAIIDASSVTAIRTAAVSGVATQRLARPDARALAILGSGVQAASHLEAMRVARPIERVRVWSRTAAHARAFAESMAERHDIPVEPVGSVEEAAAGADIICTTTAAREPILFGDWLTPGVHINVVGSSTPTARELDTAAVTRARLFVDSRESARHEAGDFLIPFREGAIGEDHIQGELGELLLGHVAGRSDPEEITVFKSLGLAVEDVAAAVHIYQQAVDNGLGLKVELGGQREHWWDERL